MSLYPLSLSGPVFLLQGDMTSGLNCVKDGFPLDWHQASVLSFSHSEIPGEILISQERLLEQSDSETHSLELIFIPSKTVIRTVPEHLSCLPGEHTFSLSTRVACSLYEDTLNTAPRFKAETDSQLLV